MSCSEWKKYTLYDLVDIIGGGTPKTTVEEYWNGNINWISVKDFNGERKHIENTEKTITELGLNKSSTKLLNKKDIIISARGTVGALGVIKKPMAFNQSCYGLRAKPNIVNSDFLYYLMKNSINMLKNNTHGSVFNTITKDTFKCIEVEIPNLEEQEKIANILSSLDDKIELNNEMNKTLEEMAQSIFKRWFVDFEFPNEDGQPYKSSGGDMVESELGMIPRGWKVGTLENVGIFKNGKAINQESRYDNGKHLIYGSNGIIGKTDDILQDNNCIIIGRVGAYCGSIQLSLEPCWVTDNAIMGIAKEEKYLPYLHRFLLNYPLREVASGSAQPLINQSILKSITTVIPTQDLFEKYYDISKNILLKIDENIKENNLLLEIRDIILPKLMRGDICI